MPKRKQPLTLRDTCIRNMREMLHGVLRRWIRELCQAQRSGLWRYRQQVEDVKSGCQTVNEFLTSLPIHILDDLTPLVAGDFVQEISSHHKRDRGFKPVTTCNEKMHSVVCTNMLKSVLLPSTRRYNTSVLSGFDQEIMIQTFNWTSNLTHLVFDFSYKGNNSALLASNIRHLKQLVSFQYNYHCTDEVLQQLALHCTKLKKLDVSYSTAVTDVSVEHLLKLENLSDVNLMWTSVSCESYVLLITQLPKIANITWFPQICSMLSGVSVGNLQTITHVWGHIYSSSTLTRTCPNIRSVTLYSFNADLSSLAALEKLVEIRIEVGDYVTSNMDTVLQGVGHRLERLHLIHINNVNIHDIVTLCSCLLDIEIYCCSSVPTSLYTDTKCDLPHFQSVNSLTICQRSGKEVHVPHLGYYVNLISFTCIGVHFLNDDFMDKAVKNGAFRNIEHFEVDDTDGGDLSMDTVWLLLNNCEHLNAVGRLRTWRRVSPDDVSNLETRVRSENLDLKMIT